MRRAATVFGLVAAAAAATAPPAAAQLSEIAVLSVSGGDERLTCGWSPAPAPENAFTFSDGARWSRTATDGSGLQRGDPTTLTWSIVPDGTPIYGYIGEPSSNSDLIAFLDGIHHGGASPGGSDLTQRAWWALFDAVFDRWSEVTGLSYVYEPADDGSAFSSQQIPAGQLGVRGDVRIGGHSIDGQYGSNVLAYNFFPNLGDMVIDTDNVGSYSAAFDDYLLFRNTLAHEHGHGIGLSHVCPVQGTKLMEPFLGSGFDGPQQDDILAGNRGYGDFAEKPDQNDGAGSATALGDLGAGGSAALSGLSVDGVSDLDVFAFAAAGGATVTLAATPTGSTYLSGPQNQNGSCSAGSSFDALRRSDLALELLDVDGASPLAASDSGGLGQAETLSDVPLPASGTYFVRVVGDADQAQMYQLGLTVTPPLDADLSVEKAVGADPSPRGASLWYTVTVSNQGPGVATGVTVSEFLPEGVTFVETSGCAEDPGGVPSCGLGTIAANAEVSFGVRVTVDGDSPSELVNAVQAWAASTDPEGDNDAAFAASTAVTFPCKPGAGTVLELDADDSGIETVHLAEGTILASNGFTVGGSEAVTFVAGNAIVLGSGFSVENGGRFHATVDDFLDCP